MFLTYLNILNVIAFCFLMLIFPSLVTAAGYVQAFNDSGVRVGQTYVADSSELQTAYDSMGCYVDTLTCKFLNLSEIDPDTGGYPLTDMPDDDVDPCVWDNSCSPPFEPNFVEDPNEDGIDCGGDTGVECEGVCGPGRTMIDGTCYVVGTPQFDYPGLDKPVCRSGQSNVGGYCVYPASASDPEQAAPDTPVEALVPLFADDLPPENFIADSLGIPMFDAGDYTNILPDGSIVYGNLGVPNQPYSSTPGMTQLPDGTWTNNDTGDGDNTTFGYSQLPDGTWVISGSDGSLKPNLTPKTTVKSPSTYTSNDDGTTTQSSPSSTSGSNAGGNWIRYDNDIKNYDSSGNLISSSGGSTYSGDPAAVAIEQGNSSSGSGNTSSGVSGDEYFEGTKNLQRSVDATTNSVNGVTDAVNGVTDAVNDLADFLDSDGSEFPDIESEQSDINAQLQSALDEHGDKPLDEAIVEAETKANGTDFSNLPVSNALPDRLIQVLPTDSSQFSGFPLPFPFQDHVLGVEASEKIKSILSWVLYISTLFYCFNVTIMADSRDT